LTLIMVIRLMRVSEPADVIFHSSVSDAIGYRMIRATLKRKRAMQRCVLTG
jgi:hypothetical protein